MGFWSNVEEELKFQDISRKELAFRAGISYKGIGLGLARDSMPGADTALRISKVLNVSIEYLLGDANPKADIIKHEMADFRKYKSVLHDLEKLPVYVREPICQMIHRVSQNFSV